MSNSNRGRPIGTTRPWKWGRSSTAQPAPAPPAGQAPATQQAQTPPAPRQAPAPGTRSSSTVGNAFRGLLKIMFLLLVFTMILVVLLWALRFIGSTLSDGMVWVDRQVMDFLEEAKEVTHGHVPAAEETPPAPISSLSRGDVREWMEPYLAADWHEIPNLYEYTYHGTWQAGESGFDALPVNLALLDGGTLKTDEFAGKYLTVAYDASLYDQHLGASTLPRVRNDEQDIMPGASVLFVKMAPRQNTAATGNHTFSFKLMVTLEPDSGFRFGWRRIIAPKLGSETHESVSFGWLPLIFNERQIDWEAQINFVALEDSQTDQKLIDDSGKSLPVRVPSPVVERIRSQQVALYDVDDRLIGGINRVREGSVKLSSKALRQARTDGTQLKQALLRIWCHEPCLVHVIVRFDDVLAAP